MDSETNTIFGFSFECPKTNSNFNLFTITYDDVEKEIQIKEDVIFIEKISYFTKSFIKLKSSNNDVYNIHRIYKGLSFSLDVAIKIDIDKVIYLSIDFDSKHKYELSTNVHKKRKITWLTENFGITNITTP